MNRISLKIGMAALLLVALCWHNAAAIGAWVGGKVTRAPWRDQGYLYISIDNVKYTVMPEVKVQFVYTANKMITSEPISVTSLRTGDVLNALAEGNLIYQIEKSH